MNSILELKGKLQQQKNLSGGGGGVRLPVGSVVQATHLDALRHQLQQILEYWKTDKILRGALVSVYYHNIVAKSNRIKSMLCIGSADPNSSIRGSKFFGENPIQHVFTHFVSLDVLIDSIEKIEICSQLLKEVYSGQLSWEDVEKISKEQKFKYGNQIAKTTFLKIIVDANYVEHFGIDRDISADEETSIITIYNTGIKTSELLRNIGIDMIDAKVIDDSTIRLDPDELKVLKSRAPYLISMKTVDISKLLLNDIDECESSVEMIPAPNKEPIVGVIDTLFYEGVYFKKWVEHHRVVDESIETTTQDCVHGTEVTSIIVDGPAINPHLDDGCGRFRVRHFGVATQGRFSSFTILKAIRDIIAKNRDIKVWNLSLGSMMQINRNFISPEGAELDKIQSEYDVVFVVAGTNKPSTVQGNMLIGAPADSLNSIVVNSVDFNNQAVDYHRSGPVLSFFNKPDISYYGGDKYLKMRVCTPFGEGLVSGTSFAAPWITRKMAYLMHTMGFTREVAKALLIDAAAGWSRQIDLTYSIGYGVVPKRIEDIIQTKDDEIRFTITGSAESYETYTYNLPIPVVKGKHPFFARATLCYFPKCLREQGVDYTSTEMDIHFGRVKMIKDKKSQDKATIVPINANKQGDTGHHSIREESARNIFRKWDNVKLIGDVIKDKFQARKVYETGMWGLSIKTKERLSSRNGKGLQFGVVVTLKEMYGQNRIDDFIKFCMLRGWIVNQISVENRLDVYAKAEEDINFE